VAAALAAMAMVSGITDDWTATVTEQHEHEQSASG
jgi:hypothetical protein